MCQGDPRINTAGVDDQRNVHAHWRLVCAGLAATGEITPGAGHPIGKEEKGLPRDGRITPHPPENRTTEYVEPARDGAHLVDTIDG
jgi:hypothetical protein